jgi:putative transposase
MNIIPFSQGYELKSLSKGVQQGLNSVEKGTNQGANQGTNLEKMVGTYSKSFKNSSLQGNEAWLTAFEGANLLSVSIQAVQKNCKAGKYVTQLVQGNGGMQYRIALSSLPIDAQLRWRKEHGFLEEMENAVVKSCKPFDEMSEQQRQSALNKYDLVIEYQAAIGRAKFGKILEAKELFVRRYLGGEWPVLLERVGDTSWKTLDRWIAILKEHQGQPSSLAPNYRYTRDGAAVVGISMEQGEMILGYFLHGNQPKVSEVVRKVNRRLAERGMEQVTENRARRFLKEYNINNESSVVMAREGEKAYNDKCAPYISRNNKLILPGDIMVSDGHKIAFPIQHPVTGRPMRMMLISHQDQASRAILGWEIMPSENTAAIASSFRRSMLWLGTILTGDEATAFVPRSLKIDNGKAFKSAYFTGLKGETMVDVGGIGLYDQLRPFGFKGVSYSRVYNGQEKTIERFWGNFAEMERSMPNYTGTSIAMKPAHLRRGEFMHREVAAKLQVNTAPTIAEAHYLIALWMHENNLRATSKSSQLEGKSPYEALEAGLVLLREKEADRVQERLVSRDELTFLMMRQTTKTLRRNGISLFGRQYLSAELHDLAKGARELVVRYDFDRLDGVAVYHPNGEFLCFAPEFCPNGGIHPAAKLLGTPEDVAAYHKAASMKNSLHRSTRRRAKTGLLSAAEKGFNQLVGAEVMPDVVRQQVKAAEVQAQKEMAVAKATGTDGAFMSEEERDRKNVEMWNRIEEQQRLNGEWTEEF